MSPTPRITHRVIAASAGSGKTFQLANRYIGLLLAGIPPARIVALTFSRKAAGEILDKILSRLAAAAATGKEATALAEALGAAGYFDAGQKLDCAAVRKVLRSLLDQLHVARIGTLDSFFVSVIRAFPFEFGLSGTMDIMDDHAAGLALTEVLDRVLGSAQSATQRADFLEQFKRATFGQESRSFTQRLEEFVASYHRFFLDAPSSALWGDAKRIWKDGIPSSPLSDEELQRTADELRREAAGAGLTPARLNRFEVFAQEVLNFNPGLKPEQQTDFFLRKIPEHLGSMEELGCEITIGGKKPVALSAGLCQPLAALIHHVIGSVLALHLTRTNGIGQLLATFEATYEQQVRGAGQLTFQDIQYLLGRGDSGEMPVLSGVQESDRLYIDYRLDGSFDHWLLDEFQDTSTVQWQALSNLADEILTSQEGDRSFFYVGDVKQAIYAWRYGDHTLFGRVLDHYNKGGERIEVQRLATSYRSSPVIMEAVNQVFSDLSSSGFSEAVQEEWGRGWQEHRSVRSELSGSVEYYEIEKYKGMSKEFLEASRIHLVATRLLEIRPWERGLTAAILVRSGSFGERVVSQLRRAGLPVTWEGDYGLLDSSAVQSFLSLLQAAAHPGDTFATRHLEMVPAGSLFRGKDGTLAIPTLSILEGLAREGFEGSCRHFARRLARAGLCDTADGQRLEQLAVAASIFDRSGQRQVLDFIDFVGKYRVGEEGSPEAIRVMTIHKSKGLEFDLVVLPELENRIGMATVQKTGIHLHRGDSLARSPQWALLLPPRAISEADKVLSAELRSLSDQNAYEALCLLYVAITRAARALIMVGTSGTASSNTIYPSTLLRNSLGGTEPIESQELPTIGEEPVLAHCLYRAGDPDWYAEAAVTQRDTVPGPAKATPIAPRRIRHPRKTPSGEEEQYVTASSLFAPTSLAALELGTAVHALFEEVEWAARAAPDKAIAAARKRIVCPEEVWQRAEEQLRCSLNSPAVLTALTRPADNAELWREREFEALVENHWVSGCFDRVQLERDESGRPVAATILDYKTSNLERDGALEEALSHYRPQMELYRKVLAQLVGLDESAIALKLVFTRDGLVELL
jgi:ATP-dependent helicase/nuclease subunit A